MNANILSVYLATEKDAIRTTFYDGQSILDALKGIQAVADEFEDLHNAQIEVWGHRGGGWIACTAETAGVARPNFWVHVVRFPGAELVPFIGYELAWVYEVAGLKEMPHDVVEQDCRGDVKEGKAIRVVLWLKGSEGPLIFLVPAASNDTVCLGQCGAFRAAICEGGAPDSVSIIGALSADVEMDVWVHPFGRWFSRSLWTTLPVRRNGQTILVKTSSTCLVVGLGTELEAQDSSRAYYEDLDDEAPGALVADWNAYAQDDGDNADHVPVEWGPPPAQVPVNNAGLGPLEWGAPQVGDWQDVVDSEEVISLSSGDESDATVVIAEGDWRIPAGGGGVVRKRKRSASMKQRIAKRREQLLSMREGLRVFLVQQGSKEVIDLTHGETADDAIDIDRA
ncbi:uncharacterized protein TRAVEDRAFT_53975 [Trametes versicolor FP-101664 SS1]|uniref:Uncharacterized protein n=1 Tax=Trametes versicolor (strain FP-101664) TaxID=717944 RepID=R7S7L3_TRAVS|nr:uncharacterized protein TRAVEDRAFT_53975 [Trametes versicolor FP-101664 SS1]EIW51991.1 hypothetical protein TRAVEDRAFT_53975 [Trametes versicolor FP-101664 SS1]